MQYLLLQVILIPIVGAALVYPISTRLGKDVGWVSFISLLYTTLLLLYSLLLVSNGLGSISEYYAWAPTAGLTFGFLADGLSLPVALIMNLILLATTIYSMPYMKKRISSLYGEDRKTQYGVYYLNFLLLSSGIVGIALSTNLIELYLFLELVLVPTFLLISNFGYVEREKVAIMYFIWNHLGAFIFLAGIVLAYVLTGSFDISSLRSIQAGSLSYWVVGLILVGWLIKMAIFGFHMWLPITEAEPPTSFAPTMAVIAGVGNYVLLRLVVIGMPSIFQVFSFPLMVWAVLTMLYGGAVTMVQNDTKYLYAWSTVSQNAYSVLAISSLTILGVTGGVFYFLSHILGKFILFAIAGIILTQTGLRDMREMGGLASKMPLTAALCLIGSMILSALPPTSGFQAEWIMFAGIFLQGARGSMPYMAVAILGLIATMFTLAYTFWPVKRIFFGPLPSSLNNISEAPLTMTLPLLLLAIVSIIIGIYPDIIFKSLIEFTSKFQIGGR